MKVIGAIFRVIFNRWVLLAIGLLALALVVWWVFPTISISNFRPYEQEWVRIIQIAFIVLTPVARWAWRYVKARRANAALASGLLQASPAAGFHSSASTDEATQLRQRFEEALGLLRKLRFGVERPSIWMRMRALGSQQYLYNLPWYVFIGAPGAGKTTALVNSGLRFPLADRLGREAVRGVGGTRNCDWWFTDEAVFLDTAGRYTTQQSDRDVDASAWKSFLELLKKSRPRRPINGVLVTVSVGDLLQQTPAEREAHTQAVRARVQELYQTLGLRIPVYVLVTKSDLLAGFSEFFAAMGKEERAQAWGFSLPYGKEGLDPGPMSAELERLERRLYDRLPERLEEERDAARRALLYGFPQQFALLRDRLVQFVESAFTPSKFEAKLVLRGVYFTSGTQEGSPIDRVMGALARGFGLERRLLPAQHASGRSYFLTRLLREVVFQEAGLAGFDLRWERRRQWLQTGAIAACGVVLVLATLAWWVSAARNRRYLAEVSGKFGDVQQQVTAVRAGARSDLASLLPTLSGVASLAETPATLEGVVPWSMRLGLYQGGRLETASGAAYRRMLQDTFLPSLASYLEQYLRQDVAASQDELYEALKTYLMLYDPKHLDPEAVWRWYQTRGEQLLGSDTGPKALKVHFDALYDRGWVDPTVQRNDALIARVRTVIGSDSLPNRVYGRLKREPNPDLREFTVTDKAGPKALLVFERQSRQPLTKGVPGFYTKDGYYKYFLPRVDASTAQLADEEAWVLGTSRGGTLMSAPGFAEAVKRLYLEDYRRIWRQFIGDISIIRDRDFTRLVEITRVLSSLDSPLKPLMKAIERETTLSVPPEVGGTLGGLTGKAQEYASKARQTVTGVPTGMLEKGLVDDQFDDIRRFVSGPAGATGPPPIDGLVQLLGEVYQWLAAVKEAQRTGQPPPQANTSNKLRAEAAGQPEPLRSMLQAVAQGATQGTAGRERERIDAELRAQVADYCTKATSGRYPFVRSSNQDVTPEDFARLFSQSGVLESFFQKYLSPHVDTGQKPWRFKDPAMGQSAALAEFQRAQVIRDVFFRGGGSTPSIQLEFRPVEMDASIQQFSLDVDGKLVKYSHGPQIAVPVQFPGPGGRSMVRAQVSPSPAVGSNGVTFNGPWALFRMFDGVQIVETRQSERFVATFNVEGRRTVFEIFASSVRNPFRLPELSQFRCPTAL
ncbi:MAG: type VI secretion system membrane subunit TssM [Candidatus Rokuibacteriota bacterium]|nr:MAG: type VI secretion system membrane subunit TssM [Candidatus Rokubacteria bacterium]